LLSSFQCILFIKNTHRCASIRLAVRCPRSENNHGIGTEVYKEMIKVNKFTTMKFYLGILQGKKGLYPRLMRYESCWGLRNECYEDNMIGDHSDKEIKPH
jgi:hypothetical protein